MDIGMLWYDPDPKPTLEAKVQRAAEFYRTKYGRPATECWVHPSLLAPDGKPQTFGTVRVRASKTIIKDHFWLGLGEPAAV